MRMPISATWKRPGHSSYPWTNNNRWYRYHHLFAEMLKSRLEQVRNIRRQICINGPVTGLPVGANCYMRHSTTPLRPEDMQFAIGMLGDSWMDLLGAYALEFRAALAGQGPTPGI